MNEKSRSQRLDLVNRKLMIVNAHALIKSKYKNRVLWAFIADICGVGSTSACEICRECGWNPDQDCGEKLGW